MWVGQGDAAVRMPHSPLALWCILPLRAVDLLGVDLDAVVSIERGRIALYQQQQQQQPAAPPPGSGLNQPALLTFRRMTVRSVNDRRTVDAFRGKLMQASARMNGVFVHYDPDEGVWLMKMDAWL